MPLGTVAFGTLPPALRTDGTGLFNLTRNIGANIGISLMSYLLVRDGGQFKLQEAKAVTPAE